MTIWGHTIVKNEEKYLWYSVVSVIDHLDKLLIWDTGSTDNTTKVIATLKDVYKDKIIVKQSVANNKAQITVIRQQMLIETKSDWIFILDGDEVWWHDSIEKVVKAIRGNGTNLESVAVPFINLLGDIYHFQDEKFGKYKIDTRIGFLTIRAINRTIPGLHVDNPYPLEGYFDNNNILIQDRPAKNRMFIEAPYLHFSHLVRSDSLKTDRETIARQFKRKIELGIEFPTDFYYPEAFFFERPPSIQNVWECLDREYKMKALALRPILSLYRKLK